MITRQANPINDREVVQFLNESPSLRDLFVGDFPSPAGEWRAEFLDAFEAWRPQSGASSVVGLADWFAYATEGTTEAFANFDLYWPEKKTCVMQGEYPYHGMVGAQALTSIEQIPDSAKLIISYPFSASGNPHEDFDFILTHCSEKGIPVLLDCALLHLTTLPQLNIDKYPCIAWVAFSLSKNFSSGRFRAGVLYTKKKAEGIPLSVLSEWSYLNHLALNIHVQLMKNFHWKYLFEKYRESQKQICKELHVDMSRCVMFGISELEKHDEFKRPNGVRRLCLSKRLMMAVSDDDR